MGYDYKQLREDMDRFLGRFPFAQNSIIGYSVMKNPIHCIKIGDGDTKIFINCAHHGLEYLTSAFIMRFLREYAAAIKCGGDFFGYNAADLRRQITLYVVPMVNPDGVDIAVNGLDITNPYHQRLISLVGIHSFNRVWQANARGVDINHNYNAGWRVVKTKPSPTQYSGPYSESEPETKAIVDFIRKEKFDLLIAFHSQGGEIYYDFDGMVAENSRVLAEKMAQASGYAVCTPVGSAAFGGCKDWFIKEFGKAGFTVEIGHGKNPLPMEQLDEIYEENARLILSSVEELHEQA
ncbi:MAG: M14 family metallocarboxypeptidase [Clostridia bacterium]|nr:M14 family metallocarboxypeptidase [Clostridia bacterium]